MAARVRPARDNNTQAHGYSDDEADATDAQPPESDYISFDPSIVLQQTPCVVLRFKHHDSSSLLEAVTNIVVGDEVHVDMTISDPNSACTAFRYSCYAGCKMGTYLMDENYLFDPYFTTVAIPIRESDRDKFLSYLNTLSKSDVLYNWADAYILMPFNSSRRMHWSDTMINEDNQDYANPAQIKKLFCSQMVIVALRHCLHPVVHRHLLCQLHQVNCRLTSPCKLFSLLQPFVIPIDTIQFARQVQIAKRDESSKLW